jgi:hypothetical protein
VDGEGWSFVHALDSCTTLDEDLAERALLPGTRIEVTRGGTSEQHAPLEILPLDEAFHYACGRGWSYDYRAACWRAPDEALLPPAPGPHVERLEVAFQPPEWGWIDVRFTAGSVSFEQPPTCGIACRTRRMAGAGLGRRCSAILVGHRRRESSCTCGRTGGASSLDRAQHGHRPHEE